MTDGCPYLNRIINYERRITNYQNRYTKLSIRGTITANRMFLRHAVSNRRMCRNVQSFAPGPVLISANVLMRKTSISNWITRSTSDSTSTESSTRDIRC